MFELLVQSPGKFLCVISNFVTITHPKFVTLPSFFKIFKNVKKLKILKLKKKKKTGIRVKITNSKILEWLTFRI